MRRYMQYLILMILAVLLCGCDADTANPGNPVHGQTAASVPKTPQIEEMVYETNNVFKYRKLTGENGAQVVNWSIQQVGEEFWFLNWYSVTDSHPGGLYYDIYDGAGIFQRSLKLPDVIQQNNAVIVATPDGERFYTNEIVDSSWMQFCCYDADGNLLAQSKNYARLFPVGDKYIENMQFFGEDLFYYKNYALYRFPMGDITQDAQKMEFPCYPDFVSLAPDGRLNVSGTIGSDIFEPVEHFLLDVTTGESEKHELKQNGKEITAIFTDAQDVETVYLHKEAIYAFCSDGLYVARNGVSEQIINWSESYLYPSSLSVQSIISDQCFFIAYNNPLSFAGHELGMLCLTDERRSQKRTVFSLATIGLTATQQTFLDAAVFLFNRDNAEYAVEYHNYYAQDDDYVIGSGYIPDAEMMEAAQRQFEEDLLAGIVYDCYVFPEQSSNRDMLADKGLLADLSQYLEEDQIMGCVETAYETEDGIIALPYFMKLSTLMTSQFILSPQEKLTYDVLMDIAADLKEGETLFSENVYENLKITGQYEFLDTFNGTCNFDSDTCTEWLTFLMDVKNGIYSDASLQIIHSFSDSFGLQTMYSFSPFIPDEIIHKKLVKFTDIEISSVHSLAIAYWLYSKDRINFCGYPSEDETVVLLSADSVLSITSNARCPEGAAAFLDFLFSAEIQCCDLMTYYGIPVSREGLTAAFDQCAHFKMLEISHIPGTAKSQDPWFQRYPDAFRLYCSLLDEKMDELTLKANNVFDVVQFTPDDRDLFLRFLDRAVMRTAADATLQSILDEELSYVESGVRSPEEAGKILQSRVGIYLAE